MAPARKHLDSYVDIAQRFQRSVNLEHDALDPRALEGYVVSPLARDSAIRIAEGVASTDTARCWSIVGPYGSGKSSFLTFLMQLLTSADPDAASWEMLRKAKDVRAKKVNGLCAELGQPLLPIPITGERAAFSLVLARGLLNAIEQHLPRRATFRKLKTRAESVIKDMEEGRTVRDTLVVELFEDVATTVAATSEWTGVFIVLDEMGKLLEWSAQQPSESDVYLLQLLAESASRLEDARLVVLTVLHQGFEAYSSSLPAQTRAEWEKISGRFEVIPYVESARHLIRLISGAVQASPKAKQTPLFKRLDANCDAITVPGESDQETLGKQLRACFPLNPVTAISLGPVFRLKIAQNERSLFSFLSSHEPQGFQDYLRRVSGAADDSAYSLADLFDYLVENTGARLSGSTDGRNIAAGCEAIERLPADASPLHARLLKAIAILTAIRRQVPFPASAANLSLAFDEDEDSVREVLSELEQLSLVVFRRFVSGYQIWDGSDLEITKLVEAARTRLLAQGGFAEQLGRGFNPQPVVASRHYHQTGTLRFLLPRFVSATPDGTLIEPGGAGDGELIYLVPDRPNAKIKPHAFSTGTFALEESRPVVLVAPSDKRAVVDALLEYFSVRHVLEHTPELSGDPVARRTLEEQAAASEHALRNVLASAYSGSASKKGVAWHVLGESDAITVRGRPGSAASDVFDRVFHSAPVILNELANRHDLSSAAASARREVLERMLGKGDEARLGIEGTPPELSIYRSALEVSGLHRKVGGKWVFRKPSADSSFLSMWKHLESRLSASRGTRLTFGELVDELGQPPFGIRRGVAPILLMAYYLANKDDIFIYEDGSFLPEVGPDLVLRLLKHPKSVEFQEVKATGDLGKLTKALAKELDHEQPEKANVLDVTKRVIGQVHRLSPYAQNTHRVSERARRARAAVKGARDPVRLLRSQLPEALQVGLAHKKRSAEAVREYARETRHALDELNQADAALVQEVNRTILRLLGHRDANPSIYRELADRAKRIEGRGSLTPSIARFVALTANMDARTASGRVAWVEDVAVAAVGKPLTHWGDSDLPAFSAVALEFCRGFLAAEQLQIQAGTYEGTDCDLYRISILGTEGNERSGIAVLRAEERDRVEKFTKKLIELAKKHKIDTDNLAYSVIVGLLDITQDESAEVEGTD